MKKLVLPLVALLLMGLLAACGGGTSAAGAKEVTIELEANATTGYEWQAAADPEGIVEVSGEYLPDSAPSGMVGVGGTQKFVLKGLAEGETQLTFTYSQPWDTSTPAAETVVYKVTVDKDLNLVATKQ